MKKILGRYILLSSIVISYLCASGEVSITMKSDKDSVFIGEPIVVSVIISEKAGVAVNGSKYEKPDFSGFLVKEAKNNITTIENGYEKTKLNYILIPQKAGTFNIKPAKADISVQNGVQSLEFMGIVMQTSSPKIEHLVSNSLSIAVKPAPLNIDLVGDFTISAIPNIIQSKANKPIILTLNIEGNGVVDDMHDLDYGIDGVTTYANKAKISQNFSNTTFKSSYQKEYIFVSDHSFIIPAQTISIFNPTTNSIEKKALPSQNITITGGSITKADGVISEQDEKDNGSIISSWLGGAIGFISGLVIALLFGWLMLNKSKKPKIALNVNVISKLLPYAKYDIEADEMVRNLYAKQKGDKNIKIDKKKLKQLLTKYESKIK